MKKFLVTFAAFAALLGSQPPQPLRIFIRSSVKTHPPGMHDYPQFLTDWKTLLTDRGALVDGAPRFPTAEELAKTDVMIDYASDGGMVKPDERALLDIYLKRGGGLVVIHDGMCSDDPVWFGNLMGGAKKHGEHNWHAGKFTLHIEDSAHPILKGQADFELDDEMFFLLRTAPEMHVLATTPEPSGKPVPQLWTMEKTLPGGRPYRTFVSLQGHRYTNFATQPYQTILLRGIAWAAQRPVDSLMPH